MHKRASLLRAHPAWFWAILALAVVLRVWIAAYNTDANDDHLEVIQKTMASGEMPVVGDCWQCYHVKAFHYPAAVALARLSIDNPIDQLRALQFTNVALGTLTLLLIWSWLARSHIGDRWKLALFGLVALNPRLAAINAEVTNDTLVIFAATACFVFYARFLDRGRPGALWAALVFAALAMASKASGIVVAIVLLGHLGSLGLFHLRRLPRMKGTVAATLAIGIAAFAAVPYSGYLQNAREAGSPLANNIEKFPFPNWVEEKRWSQAGTIDVVDTYLTFPWADLVAYPYINKSPAFYPEHRTSHWAQLYARHAFSRFEHWPQSWSSNGYWVTRVGQAAMVLSLVPLALLLAGLGSLAAGTVGRLRRERSLKPLLGDSELFLGATALAMIAMSLKLSLDFQTYAIMKAIYIYPGMIGIVVLLTRGAALLQRAGTLARRVVFRVLLLLMTVHVLDLAILATDLNAAYAGRVQQLASYEPLALRPGQVRLDQLEPLGDPYGEGAARRNQSLSGLDLTGGYRKFRYGLGMPSSSLLQFELGGEYAWFETRMALADEARSTDGAQFEIRGDGQVLYRGPMLVDHQVDHARVNVAGVRRLGLRVLPLGSSHGDLANWLHPVLTPAADGASSNIDKLLE